MVKDFTRPAVASRFETGLQYAERRHYLRMLKDGWLHEQMGLR